MIDLSSDDRMRAFGVWLRTGRLPSAVTADGVEFKFNPWHDPTTGRFTFVGGGRQHGGWGDGGFTGGGGGSVGGGGASGSWGPPQRRSRPAVTRAFPVAVAPPARVVVAKGAFARPASVAHDPFRTVVRNGYAYEIDAQERTRRVSGALTVADRPIRSRTSQARAGGAERRATDDGGHYIAARFNGPTEAFNHFAQDASFNRGRYRLLEDQWAREKRAGKRVTVKIVPHFEGAFVRPAAIDVSWIADGHRRSIRLPNARSETPRGKR